MATTTKESASTFGDFRGPNQLDPGPRPRPKRKFPCRTVLYSFLVLIALGIAWLFFLFLRGIVRSVQDPHANLYQDLNEPYRPQDVVRPLVDSNQTFDIVATVWLRTQQVPVDELSAPGEGSYEYSQWDDGRLEEKAIFSETVFTGLSLKDKRSTFVKLQVPVTVFKTKDLNNYDLRASFVLVPTSHSLLDDASSYSSWIPREAHYPPVRSWLENRPTLADEIIDSFGTFTPLLSFHGIESRCMTPETSATSELHESRNEEDSEQEGDIVVTPSDVTRNRKKWTFTSGKPILSTHPYIITRSFVRVVDMTRVLNKQAYANIHNKLRATSCGRLGSIGGYRNHARWKDCARSFLSTGTQEVKIKLTKTDESGNVHPEWLYAPYLAVSRTGWGPNDLVPVPVNRESCLPQSAINTPEVFDGEYVNITWNIGFAGRTPIKFALAEALEERDHNYNMTDGEHKHLAEQSLIELTDSLAGHRHRTEYHPRLYLGLTFIKDFILFLSIVLEVLYWYTRSSTTGISINGTTLVAVALILKLIMDVGCMTIQDEETFGVFSLAWKLSSERILRAILMLKAVTRAELFWSKKWIPTIRFSPATHSERASGRIDYRVSYRSKAAIYLTLAVFFYIVHQFQFFIVSPTGVFPFKTRLSEFLDTFPRYAIMPAFILGRLLQIILNFRSKTFGGMYKATTYLTTLEMILIIASRSPWIVGEAVVNSPVTFFTVFELVYCTLLAFQSFKYPSVSDTDEDDTSTI